jgi:uncharacterized protein
MGNVARLHEVEARWSSWRGDTLEVCRLGWENAGWTAEGVIGGIDIHYAVRLDEDWNLRQFMLFRDLEDPDLWLARDIAGRWGEMNGVYRRELDGCTDVDLVSTPFTNTLPIRRLGLEVGGEAEVLAAWIDHESLNVAPVRQRYTRLAERQWRYESLETGYDVVLDVDEHGLVLDYPDEFRRV